MLILTIRNNGIKNAWQGIQKNLTYKVAKNLKHLKSRVNLKYEILWPFFFEKALYI